MYFFLSIGNDSFFGICSDFAGIKHFSTGLTICVLQIKKVSLLNFWKSCNKIGNMDISSEKMLLKSLLL